MRMRHKPYARPELRAWPHSIDDPAAQKGRWRSVFFDERLPLRLELGCGKGRFLATLALREPAFNYLGVDIKSEVLVVAKRTAERLFAEAGRPVKNLAITSWEIERLAEILSPEDNIQRVYINFCNPWTKAGHAKHRLTHPRQLAALRGLLPVGAELWFKTDNPQLFNDSLRYFEYTGFEVTWRTDDLHRNEPAFNIRTEHEDMFTAQGIPIRACIARMLPAHLDLEAIRRLKNI